MSVIQFPRFPADGAPPQPADPAKLALALERWSEAITNTRLLPDAEDRALLAEPGPAATALLQAVFGNSPFLTGCLIKDPGFLVRVMRDGPEATLDAVMAETRAAAFLKTTPEVMSALRIAKRRVALLTALADIANLRPLSFVVETLSDFAGAATSAALDHLLMLSHSKGELVLPHPDKAGLDSGVFVLGMGKLGGRELNYSSDIDLIVLFDHSVTVYQGPRTVKEALIRLTRDLVRILDERTGDGYVFRTDLRLRPDPGSTALVMTVAAAEIYYESRGQNWERAAMIKARPVAGDFKAAEQFLKALRPFIWRRHLDFAAIEDIHSMKRQIYAVKGGATIAVAGHDIKTGRGGIREIEFFAQTQQLIRGGRDPRFQVKATLTALEALTDAHVIAPETRTDLEVAYVYLRWVEHRLQMIHDEQTQTLPEDPEKLDQLAIFLGYADATAFQQAILIQLHRVEDHYAELFEDSPSLAAAGNLVFTGVKDDPETLKTLQSMGFPDPAQVTRIVRNWHFGRPGAPRSVRARECLTALVPGLLQAFSETARPGTALLRFDGLLDRIPTGLQLFELLLHNRELLTLLAEIMGDAPRLAAHLARHPFQLDALLDEGYLSNLPDPATRAESLHRALDVAEVFEDVLDITRRWANDARFQVGLLALGSDLDPGAEGEALSDIADACLKALLPRVTEEFAQHHGHVPGGGLAVIALGKLGSREMTASSDLDLIVIYHADPEVETSDGAKPLPVTTYFTRLTQRLTAALSAPTAEGALYEVDLRLRPSGNKGPLATGLTAFIRYHQMDAWTWEHMALTRGRVVCGDAKVMEKASAAISEILRTPRSAEDLKASVRDMRARMAKEHPSTGVFDVKHAPGGLVDVDFIAQYLQLLHAHENPSVLCTACGTGSALQHLTRLGVLDETDAQSLITRHLDCVLVQTVLRHAIDGPPQEKDLSPGLRAKLVRLMPNVVDYETLKAHMRDGGAQARAVFNALLGADLPLDPPSPSR
ncbi:MAG: bifunctional [glutamine synthetase] adenylyltransferase/[glutamine synthetase]-adenylyl-L-tyrosine phosphorylase [Rhodospirillaceae bacterium]